VRTLLTALLALLTASAAHAEPPRAQAPAPVLSGLGYACNGDRLTIMNFYGRYKKIRDSVHFESSRDARPVLELLEGWQLPMATELCAWDRFFFTDSVIYFQLEADLVTGQGGLSARDLHLKLLELRNRYYSEWLDTLALGRSTGFAEYEHQNVRGKTLHQFVKMGSEQFGFVEFVSSILNPSPFWGESESEEAGAYVYRLLQAKTPFSAIMPELALNEAIRTEVSQAVACVHDAVVNFQCGQNLYDIALGCSAGQDPGIALEVLGLYASQRMYLLRDLKAWMEQNMTPEVAQRAFTAFRQGSEIYFLTETIGNRCGPEGLFPRGTDVTHATVKNYHFWSEALIAAKMAEMGFNRTPGLNAALSPARMYKQTVAKVGVLYNWLLGVPSHGSTAGDVNQVLKEQGMGASFGYQLGSTDLPHGNYTITLKKLPNPMMIREITGWELVPGVGLAVDMLELDPGPEDHAYINRYTLGFHDHSDYLLMKRVIEPRILLTDLGMKVLF
jgi:hypothetical protein